MIRTPHNPGRTYRADLGTEIVDVASIPGVLASVDAVDPARLNSQRASIAGAALKEYAKHTGQLHDEPLADVLPDLIADLRHLCDALGQTRLEGYSFDDLVHQSYKHYDPELRDLPW